MNTFQSNDPVAVARSLGALIRSEAEAAEQATTLTQPVVDALRASNLLQVLIPSELGGGNAHMWTAVEVIEEISRADPSAGWSFMANSIASGIFVTRLGESAVKTIWGSDGPAGVLAGMVAPTGVGKPAEGGWIVDGTFSFGSGSGYADWVSGGVLVETEDGPELLAYVVPREQAECRGNWNVQGLVATGSFDWAVHGLFVPSDYCFWNKGSSDREVSRFDSPSLYVDRLAMTTSGHIGVALGTAKRALEEIALIAQAGKKRPNAPPIAEQQLFQHGFATADAKLRSARAYAKEVVEAMVASVARDGVPTQLCTDQVYQACSYGVRCATEVVDFAYHWGGSTALRRPHPLGRIARDMRMAQDIHLFVDESVMTGSFQSLIAQRAEDADLTEVAQGGH